MIDFLMLLLGVVLLIFSALTYIAPALMIILGIAYFFDTMKNL